MLKRFCDICDTETMKSSATFVKHDIVCGTRMVIQIHILNGDEDGKTRGTLPRPDICANCLPKVVARGLGVEFTQD